VHRRWPPGPLAAADAAMHAAREAGQPLAAAAAARQTERAWQTACLWAYLCGEPPT
jgi:hypothetical protein